MAVAGSEQSIEFIDPPAVVARPRVRRFTVQEYQRLGEVGILTEDDRVELLDGWILHRTPVGPTHFCIVTHITELLASLLPSGWHVRMQGPITLASSEPEPDVVVVSGRLVDYLTHHPTAADVALLIEVSDSSLSLDRGWKALLYAGAGIPLYWIVDLTGRRVEVLSDPGPTAGSKAAEYRSRQSYDMTSELRMALTGTELRLPVAGLFL